MLGPGLISLELQCKHNTPTLKERLQLYKYSILNIGRVKTSKNTLGLNNEQTCEFRIIHF